MRPHTPYNRVAVAKIWASEPIHCAKKICSLRLN